MPFRRLLLALSALALMTLALVPSGSPSVLGQEPGLPATAAPTLTSTPLVAATAAEFLGSVTIRGEPAPDGTVIEARIARQVPGHPVCGTTTTSGGRYRISVAGEDVQEGCGRNGDIVSFQSGNLSARQFGQFLGGTAQRLDLSLELVVAAAPSAFYGSVTIKGEPAPDGTVMEALIGDVVCGTTTTSGGRYGITVRAGFGFGGDFQEGCAGSGPDTSTVVFRTGGLIANETGRFVGHGAQELNLTFGQAPTLTTTPPTPALPDTGFGATPAGLSASRAPVLWALLGTAIIGIAAALAFRRVVR